jgi:hypothetical protein
MICGQASATVTSSPAEVLDFVWDLHRYRQADSKIGRVLAVEPDGEDNIVRFRSRIHGLPGPAARQRVHRSGDQRIDITDVASWQNRLVTFEAFVTCESTAAGTLVIHREQFDFHGAMRLIAEPFLRTWLVNEVANEVARMALMLDGK